VEQELINDAKKIRNDIRDKLAKEGMSRPKKKVSCRDDFNQSIEIED